MALPPLLRSFGSGYPHSVRLTLEGELLFYLESLAMCQRYLVSFYRAPSTIQRQSEDVENGSRVDIVVDLHTISLTMNFLIKMYVWYLHLNSAELN